MNEEQKVLRYFISFGLMAIYFGVAVLCYEKLTPIMGLFFFASLGLNLYVVYRI